MAVIWEATLPALRRPILVVAFEGWFDVAQGATGAVRFLVERHKGYLAEFLKELP